MATRARNNNSGNPLLHMDNVLRDVRNLRRKKPKTRGSNRSLDMDNVLRDVRNHSRKDTETYGGNRSLKMDNVLRDVRKHRRKEHKTLGRNRPLQMDKVLDDVRNHRNMGSKTYLEPIAEYSGATLDIEEIAAIVTRMKEKGGRVYHVSCKERFEIAHYELRSLWRQMLVNWMFYVVDCCDLHRHSVAAAVYFLDVAMLRDLCQTREEHQLAAATALQMALKTFDTAVIKLDKLVKLGRGLFTEEDVTTMEMKIIESLDWNLHPPTMYCFLRQYERLVPSAVSDSTLKIIDQVTKIIAEELTLDERYIKYCPSVQGLAAILVALDFVPDDFLSSRLRRSFELRLSTVAKVSNDSAALSRMIKKIYKTLKQRDRLQTIIDITSTTTRSLRMSQRVLRNVETNSTKTRQRNKHEKEQNSPRDVKEELNLHL